MKKRMKQLMAVMLSVALCVPAIPGAYGYAATSGTTFTQEEEIALSGLGSERSTLFNDGWKFSLSDPSGAESTSFNDGSWDAVTLPHDFSISQNFTTSGEAESGFLPGGTGWYRKSFTVPSGCDGKSVIWCATRQVDKLNNENFSSPVQFMYRVVYATFSSFCS